MDPDLFDCLEDKMREHPRGFETNVLTVQVLSGGIQVQFDGFCCSFEWGGDKLELDKVYMLVPLSYFDRVPDYFSRKKNIRKFGEELGVSVSPWHLPSKWGQKLLNEIG